MGDLEKQERVGENGEEEEEEDGLLEGMTVLDFDMLCSTVALQSQGKWRKLENDFEDEEAGRRESRGAFRMWEGELLNCFENRSIALESTCCPCYRFGKNMNRAGLGSCFIQGTVYFILAVGALLSCITFLITRRLPFIYLAAAFAVSLFAYSGFFRTQIRKKFNIRGDDSFLDDCIYHIICPCCALCQESRTLEMNNVKDGSWHGRGDTICIGGESANAFIELPPPLQMISSTKSSESLQDD